MRFLLAYVFALLFVCSAYAQPGDWTACFDPCAGGCCKMSNLKVTGVLDAQSQNLGTGSVTSTEILDATIVAGDIATGAVTTTGILDATIATGDISTGGVATGNILDATILAADFATGAVDTAAILNATILTGDISTGGVATANILDGTILAADFSTGAVDTAAILNSTITHTDVGAAIFDKIILCGDNFSTATGYGGPATAAYLGDGSDASINSTACQALDSGTEATADAPITADYPAIKVHGFFCRLSSDPTADVVFTMRSATADLTPTVTCTVAGTGSATSCRALTNTTTDIAAGATIAMKVVTLENLSAQDFWCQLYFSIS